MKIICKIHFRIFVQNEQIIAGILFRFAISTEFFHNSWGIRIFQQIFGFSCGKFYGFAYFPLLYSENFMKISYTIIYNI